MPVANSQNKTIDHRHYIRLNSIFPVEFNIVRLQGDLPGMNWQQGYTSNVSRGGICLETTHLSETTLKFLAKENILLDLRINIPLVQPPIKAVGELAWYKRIEKEDTDHHLIGLQFNAIAPQDLNRILSRARWLSFSSQTAVILSIILFMSLVATSFYTYKLRRSNEVLIDNLVIRQDEETKTQEQLKQIVLEKNEISAQLNDITQNVIGQDSLKNRYEDLVRKENRVADRLALLQRERYDLQSSVVDKMYLWLKNRQNPLTGLVLSFEGDVGIIKDWAFIYDQALATNVFLTFGKVEDARKILNFFNKKADDNFLGFYNAYFVDSGDVSEYTIHSGPNIWVGLAVMQYIHKTGDDYYLPLAEKIANWLIKIQEADPAGGIKGGPDFSWFATEHNLDAYAFFNMLYAKTQKEEYKLAAEKVFSWLTTYALIPHGKDYKSPPINRGRGDATIATDTYAWALAAIGPEKLASSNMDPEEIMKFAEENCGVKIDYRRPSGVNVNVSGFDFAKTEHVARGGMVSPEWTSQMIVSFRMLAQYFANQGNPLKADFYQEKARIYLNELNKLIISSPSAKGQGEGCLPYATLEDADTGHGFNTPYGTSTCSIAGTAYMIMAIKQVNPLMIEGN